MTASTSPASCSAELTRRHPVISARASTTWSSPVAAVTLARWLCWISRANGRTCPDCPATRPILMIDISLLGSKLLSVGSQLLDQLWWSQLAQDELLKLRVEGTLPELFVPRHDRPVPSKRHRLGEGLDQRIPDVLVVGLCEVLGEADDAGDLHELEEVARHVVTFGEQELDEFTSEFLVVTEIGDDQGVRVTERARAGRPLGVGRR